MCGLPSTRNIFFFLAILSFPNVVKIDIYDLWLVVRLYCVFSNKGLHFDSKFYYLLLHLSALKPRKTTLIIQHIINAAFKYDIMLWYCDYITNMFLQHVYKCFIGCISNIILTYDMDELPVHELQQLHLCAGSVKGLGWTRRLSSLGFVFRL